MSTPCWRRTSGSSRRRVGAARWDPGDAREAIAEAIEAERSTVLVAKQRGELLGFCSAYVELNSVRYGLRCWVEDLAVSPQHRLWGVGALLDAAKSWARRRGATHLSSTAASPASKPTVSTSERARASRASSTPGRCEQASDPAASARRPISLRAFRAPSMASTGSAKQPWPNRQRTPSSRRRVSSICPRRR